MGKTLPSQAPQLPESYSLQDFSGVSAEEMAAKYLGIIGKVNTALSENGRTTPGHLAELIYEACDSAKEAIALSLLIGSNLAHLLK